VLCVLAQRVARLRKGQEGSASGQYLAGSVNSNVIAWGCQSPDYPNVFPAPIVETREYGGVQNARIHVALLAELLDAIADELVVGLVPQCLSRKLDWKTEFVEPLGYSAIDRNLVASKAQSLEQVPRSYSRKLWIVM